MVNSSIIIIPADPGAEFTVLNFTQEATERASKVPQENHEKYDIMFTFIGFYNGLAFLALAIFSYNDFRNIIRP